MPWRSRATSALGTAMATIAVAAAAGCSFADDGGICNRKNADVPSIGFGVPSGEAVRTVIPRMGTAPELDAIGDHVDVVVFTGLHRAVPIFPALQADGASDSAPAAQLHNVVCVRIPSGEELYYTDVDISELRLDGLSVDRRDG